ncbi:MAG TPA: Sel1-like repeat-containing protein kinase family protein [Arenicellales bacterium]|nr:Sel1-like repeat-containing protein kinase family protein [Arenicellales bacterium]
MSSVILLPENRCRPYRHVTFKPRPPLRQREPDASDKDDSLSPAPLPPGARLGNFQINRLLASTDSGYTYSSNSGSAIIQEFFPKQLAVRDQDGLALLLWDASLNEDYEQGLKDFLLLGRVLSQIDHAGRVVHYSEDNDSAYYAIKFRPLASVRDLLKTGKPLPEDALKAMLYSALTYLEAAHQAGLFHLEIAPENIFVSDNEQLAICGFNTDRFHYPPADKSVPSDYRAPELSTARGRIGPWTDFYALGSVLYECITCAAPVPSSTRMDAIDRGIPDPIVPAVEAGVGYYSGSFLEIVDWLIALRTTERPEDTEVIFNWLDPDARKSADDDDTYSDPLELNLKPATKAAGSAKTPLETRTNIKQRTRTAPHAAHDRSNIFSRRHDGIKNQSEAARAALPDNSSDGRIKTSRGATAIALAALKKSAANLAPSSENSAAKPTESPHNVFAAKSTQPRDLTTTSNGPTQDVEPLHAPSRTDAPSAERESTYQKGFDLSVDQTVTDELRSAGEILSGDNFIPVEADDKPLDSGPPNKGKTLGLIAAGVLVLIIAYWWLNPQNANTVPSATPAKIEINTTSDTASAGGNPSQQISNTASEDGITVFTRSADKQKAEKFRELTEIAALTEPHLKAARIHHRAGRSFDPQSGNAYQEFSEVLLLDPDNLQATQGIKNLIGETINGIESLIDAGDLGAAREKLSLLATINQASEVVIDVQQKLDQIEKRRLEQVAAAAKAHAIAEATRQQQIRDRHRRIEQLLTRASNAFENNQFVEPQGDNALTLYRAVLNLDPNNQRARNGIGSISEHFLRQARRELAAGEYGIAEQNLRIAAAIEPQNQTVLQLQQQLQQRRQLAEKQQRLQAEAAAKKAEADNLASQQEVLNLQSGLTAYYEGAYSEAYRFLAPLAAQGDPRAQVRVARMLITARGVQRDEGEAIRLFSMALQQVQLSASDGKAWAQSDLGDYFHDGWVIDKDYRNAVYWYRRAAEQGYAPAQNILGWLYMQGHGVNPDEEMAIKWFRRAAEQGDVTALDNLKVLGKAGVDSGS